MLIDKWRLMLGTDSIASNLTPLNTGLSSNDARQRFVAGLVSVIIRAHKDCDKRLLQQSLHSVATQTYSSIEVVIATDSFETTHLQELANAIRAERWNPNTQARVESIDCSDLSDTRSRLLNEGIKRSKGQYLAFLDYDDIVYEEAYKSLIEELVLSGKGVAAGGTRVAEVTWKDGILEVENYREFPHDGKSKLDLWKGNFLPIHSFVIDRYVVPSESIYTDETLRRLEDHCLLLRLSFVTEFSLARLQTNVCEYRVFNGVFSGDRSKFMDAKDQDIASWRHSKEVIQQLIVNSTATVCPSQVRADIQERVGLECSRTEERVRAEAQSEIEVLKKRLSDAEQSNLSLSYQIEKWQASNKSLGTQLDQQSAELSRKPYKIVRVLLSWLNRFKK
jgi:hypothetical protein